jgi:hypothetical protein
MNVKITVSSDKEMSKTLNMLAGNGVVTIARGMYLLLELTFDNGVKGTALNLRPTPPILLNLKH